MDSELDGYEAGEAPEFRDYVRVLRRRLVVLVCGVVLGLALAALLWALQPIRYTSTATVLLQPVVRDAFDVGAPLDRSVDVETERRIVLSRAVAEAAGERMEPPRSADEVLDGMAVTVPGDLLLRVSFTAADPFGARDGTQAIADAYLDRRRADATRDLELSRQPLTQRSESARAELAQVVATLAVQQDRADDPDLEPDELTRIEAQTRQDLLVTLIEGLERDLLDLEAIDVSGGQVLDPAVLPAQPSSPTLPRLLLIGGVVGLLLGALGAFVRDRFDDRLLDPDRDLSSIPLPVVGRLPKLPETEQPDAQTVDAMRELRNRLSVTASNGAGLSRDAGTVTMFTASAQVPRSDVVAGHYASSLAHAPGDVLLVRANLRARKLSNGSDLRAGLSDVLAGHVSLHDAVHLGEGSRYVTLDAGSAAASTGDLIRDENLGTVLGEARRRFRHVVVDAPPALPYADDLVLAGLVDRIVVCVEQRVTDLPQLRRAVHQLRDAGGAVAGAVLVVS